ncbi:MAG: hypothetical protein V3U43_07575 [Pseudomonadales bacterium]
MTLSQAREQYFIDNDLPVDGGYDLKWVPLKLGAVRLYIYNSRARRRAVPYHDLHHVLTGYDASPLGEGEIGAWELAAGTYPHWFATLINLPAVLIGLCLSPGRVFDAFIRGRRSRSLYREPITEELLSTDVSEVQARLGLIGKNESALLSDYLTFAELCVLTLSLVLLPLLGVVLLFV